jgi:hypothetical protein
MILENCDNLIEEIVRDHGAIRKAYIGKIFGRNSGKTVGQRLHLLKSFTKNEARNLAKDLQSVKSLEDVKKIGSTKARDERSSNTSIERAGKEFKAIEQKTQEKLNNPVLDNPLLSNSRKAEIVRQIRSDKVGQGQFRESPLEKKTKMLDQIFKHERRKTDLKDS